MPKTRARSTARPLDAEADRFEPRMARALEKGLSKLRARVPMERLTRALAAGSVRRAVAILQEALEVADALTPAGQITADAAIRGHRIGREQAKKAAA